MNYHNLTNITSLPEHQIFVFGSNLAGKHGKGAALIARQYFGAKPGYGIGHYGKSYAVPTKDIYLKPLPLDVIESEVDEFLVYANSLLNFEFVTTPIGCGLAGYTPAQIAPMFQGAPSNVILPEVFRPYLEA